MKTDINPAALYWAKFNSIQFRIPGQAVLDCSASGSVDEAVAYWAPKVNRFEFGEAGPWIPTPEALRKELAEYGAWDDEELSDDAANWRRCVWLAAGDIAESESPDCSEPVKEPATA